VKPCRSYTARGARRAAASPQRALIDGAFAWCSCTTKGDPWDIILISSCIAKTPTISDQPFAALIKD